MKRSGFKHHHSSDLARRTRLREAEDIYAYEGMR
jgi:hypothetical protein